MGSKGGFVERLFSLELSLGEDNGRGRKLTERVGKKAGLRSQSFVAGIQCLEVGPF